MATVDRFFNPIRPGKIISDAEAEYIRTESDRKMRTLEADMRRRDMFEQTLTGMAGRLSYVDADPWAYTPVFKAPVEPPMNKVLLLL